MEKKNRPFSLRKVRVAPADDGLSGPERLRREAKASRSKKARAAKSGRAVKPAKGAKPAIRRAAAKPRPLGSRLGKPLLQRKSLQDGAAPAAAPAGAMPLPEETCRIAAEAASAKKAFNVMVIDVREVSGLCDDIVLCSASSNTHLASVADAVEEALRLKGQRLIRHDGRKGPDPDWVLLDYGDLMVHILREGARSQYDLEAYYSAGRLRMRIEND